VRSRYLKEAQRWRDRADQMRFLASETDDPESRTIMLRLAINYDSRPDGPKHWPRPRLAHLRVDSDPDELGRRRLGHKVTGLRSWLLASALRWLSRPALAFARKYKSRRGGHGRAWGKFGHRPPRSINTSKASVTLDG